MLNITSRKFSQHAKIAIIGAGSGGISASAQLMRSGRFAKNDIVIFDPSAEHWYQPSLTMIGGGVLGENEF